MVNGSVLQVTPRQQRCERKHRDENVGTHGTLPDYFSSINCDAPCLPGFPARAAREPVFFWENGGPEPALHQPRSGETI
jgi:hypothetical protein